VVPAFFVIFGLVHIGRAVLNYIATEDIQAEIPRLITGGILLIIGLTGVFRAMQPKQMKPDDAS
jgi:putative Mn2+ efflux pump MntP